MAEQAGCSKRSKLSNFDHSEGVVLSSKQLDELWRHDFKLAHDLLGLPLRTCSASPKLWGEAMEESDFRFLKVSIGRMWVMASLFFEVFDDGDKGWGLRVNESYDGELAISERSNIMKTMGWLAVAPKPEECPTGHRYLRSPIGNKSYLGGPISLANWDRTRECTVRCHAHINCGETSKYFVTTVKPLPPLTPLLWNYGFSRPDTYPPLHDISKWFLPECCEGVTVPNQTEEVGTSKKCSAEQVIKIRKPLGPSKLLHVLDAFRPCIYCGMQIESDEAGKKKNMKQHLACSHSVELSGSKKITSSEFLSNLHLLTEVLKCLKAYNYNVFPACSFSAQCSVSLLPPTATVLAKKHYFEIFHSEAKQAFNKFRVLFLRGIIHPSCYDDLLPAGRTNYKCVDWQGKKPASNLFSMDVKSLTKEEKMCLELSIKAHVISVIEEAKKKFA